MSLKAVELQIALPRTQEIGRIQEQAQYRQAHEHQLAINNRNELDQALRRRPANINEADQGQIKEKQDSHGKRGQKQNEHRDGKQGKKGDSEGCQMRDPFRGRHVDISL